MLLLASTSDKIQVITGAALAATVIHASWIDNAAGVITPGRTNTSVSTAATTDAVAAPAASTYRNIKLLSVRNTNASGQTITIQHTDGTTVIVIWKGVLLTDESVVIDERGTIMRISAGGMPLLTAGSGSLFNMSSAAQGAGFSSDTYLTGSSIAIPAQFPKIGTKFRCSFDVVKTAAGTATPIIQIRYGTAGAVGDASICSFTYGAGTAAADTGTFEVWGIFRSVGAGTAAVLQGRSMLTNLASTGLASTVKGVQTTSAGFNSTVAASIIGVSVNGGASASWTVQLVEAELSNI